MISNPMPGGGSVAGRPQIVAPQGDALDPHPVAWDSATPSSDGRSLMVSFTTDLCTVLDHVSVSEGPERVSITLYVGTDPATAGQPCPELGVLKRTSVALSVPLADRKVVDGAPAPTPGGPSDGISPAG